MIKKFSVLIPFLFLILCNDLVAAGQEIVSIQSIRTQPYQEAIKGFTTVCDAEVKELVISELEGADIIKKIDEIEPDMVLAIGMNALSKVQMITHIPVVYLMILNPQSILATSKNITGVSMNVSQQKQLDTLLKILPDTKNIGFLYDPNRTGYLAQRARHAARKRGVHLISKVVHDSRDVPSLIRDMKGNIDVFWMFPDITVVTPETVEFLLLFSLENKIPILTFSDKYVELGALMSTSIEAFDIGVQAGEMAKKVLSGIDVTSIQQEDARKGIVSINLKIARKLGIDIDEEIVREVRVVNRGEK